MKIKVTSSRFLPVTSSYHKGLGKTTLFYVMEQAKCLQSEPGAKTSVWPLLTDLGLPHFFALLSTCVNWRHQY